MLRWIQGKASRVLPIENIVVAVGGGVHINRWRYPGEECVPSAKCTSGLLGHEIVRCQRRATRSLLFIQPTMC